MTAAISILLIGNNPDVFEHNEWPSALKDFPAVYAAGLPASVDVLKTRSIGCVVIAAGGTFEEPVSLIEQINAMGQQIPVIVVAPEVAAATTVRMLRAGAHNCLDSNSSADELWLAIDQALDEKRTLDRRTSKAARTSEPWRSMLVGESSSMETVADTVRLAGPRKCTVLIQGETGTGKEVVARCIHMASPRATFSMVAVNCSALPESLLEAELFGHTRGAFTGAVTHRVGRFEQANKGTLFLDEIGDMPLDMQAKLLRALQGREIQRLGSSETIKVDVRIIAATNVDLLERVRQGKFREDLYYRLNVLPLRMPPLRVRTSDIPVLASHFVEKICRSEAIPVKRLTPDAVQHLTRSPWPGNVRQLENAIEMAVAMSGDRTYLAQSDFGAHSHTLSPAACVVVDRNPVQYDSTGIEMDFNAAVARFELDMLARALDESKGNKTAAAERLGIKRTTLIMKMRSLGRAGLSMQAA